MVFVSTDQPEEITPADLLSWLFEETPADPEKPLLVSAKNPEKDTLSWTQVKDLVGRLGAGFRAQGLGRGDCLCIISQTNVHYYPTVYGCIASGATFYGAPTRWMGHADSPGNAVAVAGVTHFLVDPEFVSEAVAAVEASYSGDLSRIVVFTGPDGSDTYEFEHSGQAHKLKTWASLLKHGSAEWEKINDLEEAESSIAMRLGTGGTTGSRKVAQLSHYAAIAHIHQWCRSFKTHAFEVKALYYLGLNAISGHAFISTAVKLGFPVYLMNRSVPDILDACRELKPSLMMIDPYTMLQLVKLLSQTDDPTALHSLRDVRLPAMDLPADARKSVQAAIHPDCMISRPYGLTEMGTVSAMLYNQRQFHDPSGVGYTFPGVQVKLLDEDGTEITAHDILGEILIKTPAIFKGYYDQPQLTAEMFRGDWFVTGDVGHISSKTLQWYLLGRKKYLFKVAGSYVAPEEIESALVSHPDITDAAVAPLQIGGEGHGKTDPVVRAYVTLKASASMAEEDVVAFAQSRLPPEKRVTGGVKFVDSIARTLMGKVNRAKLHDLMVQEERIAP